MFCLKCGKEIRSDVSFCPHCGAQQPPSPAQPTAASPSPANSAAAEHASGKRQRSRGALIAILAAAVLLLAGALAGILFLTGGGASAPDKTAAPAVSPVDSPSAKPPVPTSNPVSPQPSDTDIPGEAPSGLPTPVSPSPEIPFVPSGITLDLEDPTTYKKLNVFLSNFSETSFGLYEPFSIDSPNYDLFVSFGVFHSWWNIPGNIESGEWPQEDDDMPLNQRIAKEAVLKTVRKYFGAGITIPSESTSGWVQDDTYYYWTATGGDFPGGFTLVDSVSDLGSGIFQAQAHIYQGDYYDTADSRYYIAQPDSVGGLPGYTGGYRAVPITATFEAIKNADGTLTFYLRTYEVLSQP